MKASRGVAVEICKNVKKKALEDERQKEKHKEKNRTGRGVYQRQVSEKTGRTTSEHCWGWGAEHVLLMKSHAPAAAYLLLGYRHVSISLYPLDCCISG